MTRIPIFLQIVFDLRHHLSLAIVKTFFSIKDPQKKTSFKGIKHLTIANPKKQDLLLILPVLITNHSISVLFEATQRLEVCIFMAMANGGPSPVVPSLILGFLSLIIVGPTISTSINGGTTVVVMLLLPFFFLWLVQLSATFVPEMKASSITYHQSSGFEYDAEGFFGLGTFLLVVLFFTLYKIV
ncbi:PREDICTED: uncharacterized protein LOC109181855 [Ipomoea nil]|uniref:uncharacterized protein LOC109181855 n=1 Tax=Ipomoea nil TaxID=35883 RepID=UPI0009015EF5|nr:PREDICTED: uncharacterized protein LOC109181855 [Ipomoea nil]